MIPCCCDAHISDDVNVTKGLQLKRLAMTSSSSAIFLVIILHSAFKISTGFSIQQYSYRSTNTNAVDRSRVDFQLTTNFHMRFHRVSVASSTFSDDHEKKVATSISPTNISNVDQIQSSESSDSAIMAEASKTDNEAMAMEVDDSHIIPTIVPAISSAISTNEVKSMEDYMHQYKHSITNSNDFWLKQAKDRLSWFSFPYDELNSSNVCQGNFVNGDITWFSNAKLNICYNAIDRHVNSGNGDKVAMIWEGDEVHEVRKITFYEMQRTISQICHVLSNYGVVKGSVVTIYMPMIPELPMTMLACARMGAIHSVVFAGFSADALAARVVAAKSKVIITADIGKRGGKNIPLHTIVTDARTKQNMESLLDVVLVWERFFDSKNILDTPDKYTMQPKDVRMNLEVAQQRPYFVPVWIDSEDPLFILYTSGSTGQPKGLLHTTGGYALYAAFTAQQSFDLCENDVFACVADCGWITGHTYVVYGPLLNGCTTFVFESTPVYPNAGRYWDMIARHGITQFYTAPTAIRLLMRYGDKIPSQYNMLSTLRVLGTVGEPINPEAWRWYWQIVGQKQCTVVDTYWQTETGGHIVTNLPGITAMKPGSCTFPMYGVDVTILDPVSGQEVVETDEHGHKKGVLVVKQPWPGMARTCLGDHERYLQTYFAPYPGYYFTGDSAYQDSDGYTFIIGRVDDVINVSGHRIGTAEVESALVSHAAVAQAAVVGQPHPIKGQSIAAFVMLTNDATAADDEKPIEFEKTLLQELKLLVRRDIGSFATPDLICIAPTLPMTRSGKIMRRILRKIVCHETDSLGDTSTLADPSIVDILIDQVGKLQKNQS